MEFTPFTVTTRFVDPNSVVRVAGEVDMVTMDAFAEPVLTELGARPGGMILDLRDVLFFGSSGIQVLMRARDQAGALGIPLCVVADHTAVLRTLRISGLIGYFRLHSSMSEAATALAAA